MPDALEATVSFLRADAGIRSLVDEDDGVYRVFGEELPPAQAKHMPRPLVMIRRVGGIGGAGGNLSLERGVFDVICYGETPKRAQQLREFVRIALKNLQAEVVGDTLLHGFEPASAAIGGRDGERWPYVAETWSFLASEVEVA